MRFLCITILIALTFATNAMPVPSVEDSSKYFRRFRDVVDASDLCNDGSVRDYDPTHCIPFTNFP